MLRFLRHYSLYFAWLIALISLFVSLYSSEILWMPVCYLCWYQRICLYPLAIILGIATYLKDYKIFKYTLPLSILSMALALYQYLLQMIPSFTPIEMCGIGPSCSDIQFKWFGFITYPLLSFGASLIISILLILSGIEAREVNNDS